ncbi:MAG: M28 family peptidase [Pirellulales bacterium]
MGRRSKHQPISRKVSGQNLFLAAVALGSCLGIGYLAFFHDRGPIPNAQGAVAKTRLEKIPFDGARAYGYLKQICAIGRRPSGSPGMIAQQKVLSDHFKKLGGKVRLQPFTGRHPLDGSPVAMANLIVEWHPERKDRILLCAHYDTRPLPDRDPRNPKGTFIGANDGASGVAVLMELARAMPKLRGPFGVDFVLFDAEELVFQERGPYFLGSEHFARDYAAKPPGYRYRAGVLLDMVGDADLEIYQEINSMSWPETRPLVLGIWDVARRLGVREFIPQQKYDVRDDHMALRNLGKIPTCDLIDFDYPAWHTEADTPEQCSALSLAKVGWVLQEWLKAAEQGR